MQCFRVGPWLVDPGLNTISQNNKVAHVEPKAMAVLVCLVSHAGETVAKEDLLKTVWPNTFVTDDVLTRCISELRRVFEDDARDSHVIQTVPRLGYRFIAAINGPATRLPAALEDVPAVVDAIPHRPSTSGKIALAFVGFVVLSCVALALDFAGLRSHLFGKTNQRRVRSLAVLPLKNISNEPSQDYFADGMTEELITELSRVSGLTVISRTSVERYKNTTKPLPEIARELHVDAVIEGSVMRSGDDVRVTAQLIDAATDKNIWAQSYGRHVRDALAVQTAVASDIVNEIRVRTTPEETARLSRARPINPKALDAYLDGRYHYDKSVNQELFLKLQESSQEEFREAMTDFEQAVEADPNYIQAHLAFELALETQRPHPDMLPRAKAAVAKAIQLDDLLSKSHVTMGRLLEFDWNWAGAEREFKRAIQLEPNSADAHAFYGDFLLSIGRKDDWRKEEELAQSIDPTKDYLSLCCNSPDFNFRGDWTVDEMRKNLDERAPDDAFARASLAKEFQMAGRFGEAVDQWAKALNELGYVEEEAELRRVNGRSGPKAALRAWMKVVEDDVKVKHRWVPSEVPAFVYSNLNERDAAFTWLEQAYKDHTWCILYLKDDAIWNPLRPDPRFAQLLRRVGLPQ